MMKQGLAVVLVSGGMDSCVCAAIAHEQYDLAFLHVSYGHRTARQELRAFQDIAQFYGTERRLVCELSHLGQIGGSSLTNTAIPVEEADLNRPDIPSSYVPFRNAHFLSIATSWGEVLGARAIFIGAVFEDSSGYPDCRPEFIRRFEELALSATKAGVEGDRFRIHAPLINLSKADIVRRGRALSLEFGLTHSCYDPIKGGRPCGRCDSCRLRAKGFIEAGIPDPLLS